MGLVSCFGIIELVFKAKGCFDEFHLLVLDVQIVF